MPIHRRVPRVRKAWVAAIVLPGALLLSLAVPLSASAAAPVAVDDSYSTSAGATLYVPAPGVLANDVDGDGDALTTLASSPTAAHGRAIFTSDGSFTYEPDPGYVGTDTFGYLVSDGAESDVGTVTVTVSPASLNTPPLGNSDLYEVPSGVSLAVFGPGVLANDVDPDPDTLTAVLDESTDHGTLTLLSHGGFSYRSDPGFTGVDTFTYQAHDGTAASNVTTVTILVTASPNEPPAAVGDSYTAVSGQALTVAAPGVLTNDSDPDGDPLTTSLFSGPTHGTLNLSADGSFSYVPDAGYVGPDAFSYEVSDGMITDDAVAVAITVTAPPPNNPPVALGNTYIVISDSLYTLPAPGILANDTDADGDALTAAIVAPAAHGTATLNADGSFSYLSDPGFVGSDSFTYEVSDGIATSDPASVQLIVTVTNTPVANDDSYSTEPGATLEITAPGVMSNDTDPNADPLTAFIDTAPIRGTLTLEADGSFIYVAAADYTGTDTFTYQVDDGVSVSAPATVTITITAPVVVPSSPDSAESGQLAATGHAPVTSVVPALGLVGLGGLVALIPFLRSRSRRARLPLGPVS
jgi:VCBS repeat-containing protein